MVFTFHFHCFMSLFDLYIQSIADPVPAEAVTATAAAVVVSEPSYMSDVPLVQPVRSPTPRPVVAVQKEVVQKTKKQNKKKSSSRRAPAPQKKPEPPPLVTESGAANKPRQNPPGLTMLLDQREKIVRERNFLIRKGEIHLKKDPSVLGMTNDRLIDFYAKVLVDYDAFFGKYLKKPSE